MIIVLRLVCAGVSAVLLVVTVAHTFGLVWVASESVPPGLWRKVSDRIECGSVVVFRPPNEPRFRAGREAGFVPSGFGPGRLPRLVKPVAAVTGDVVEVEQDGIRVNGVLLLNTRPIEVRSVALTPYPPGRYVVREGEAWLVSIYNARSWDSRYYGPVRVTDLESAVHPVWVEW